MGSVLVPKGPRAKEAAPRDEVAEMIERLFALPLPPNPTQTRTYPTTTVLGRIMRLRGLSINEVAKIPNGPSARQLGDHLGGKRMLSREKRQAIARGLGIDGRLLD